MTDAELDALMEASARALGIVIEPAWQVAVRANLAQCLRLGEVVLAFPLPDEAEPAPVFKA